MHAVFLYPKRRGEHDNQGPKGVPPSVRAAFSQSFCQILHVKPSILKSFRVGSVRDSDAPAGNLFVLNAVKHKQLW